LQLPLAGVAVLAAAVRGIVFEIVEHPEHLVVRWQSALDEANVVARYVGLMLVPRGQTIFHELASIDRVLDPRALVGLAVVGLMVGVAWRARRTYVIASFGVFWFLLLLVPSSALYVLGYGEPMAEHRVYLASGGLFLAAGAAVGRLATLLANSSRSVRWIAGAVCAFELLSLSGRTLLRNAIWADPVALWREAADRAPDGWFSHTALGESLHQAGRDAEAVAAYSVAIRLRPTEPYGYLKQGLTLAELHRFGEAVATFRQLQRVDPTSTLVTTGLGVVAMASGDQDRARRYLRLTIARDPQNIMARQWLASLEEVMAHNPAEALRLCEEIQRIPARWAMTIASAGIARPSRRPAAASD
jgi:tetratricopeptide (TPR) repeat protein